MSKEKTTDKAQKAQEKLEAKLAKKALKDAAKANKKQKFTSIDQAMIEQISLENKTEAINQKPKKLSLSKWQKENIKKTKTEKEKINFKQNIEEFPVKMIKEVNKIKWSSSNNLTKKYVSVLIFMIVFAIVFAMVDWGLQALFSVMRIT